MNWRLIDEHWAVINEDKTNTVLFVAYCHLKTNLVTMGTYVAVAICGSAIFGFLFSDNTTFFLLWKFATY